jgi:CubicO group peptidase (beta-lactamase class C family)
LGLRFTPGTDFDYCNSNFALLGLLIEKVTHLPYKQFMQEYVFEPLKMENSFVYDPNDTYEKPYAKSYNARFTDWKNNYKDGVYGDKGIFTTATDLLKWDWALDHEAFVPKKTQDDAFTPRLPWNKHKNYGLGWRIKTYPNGEKYVYHTGWWHGYQGIFSRYIKDDLTIIILSNRFIKGISDNAEEIYNICQKELNLTALN